MYNEIQYHFFNLIFKLNENNVKNNNGLRYEKGNQPLFNRNKEKQQMNYFYNFQQLLH